MAEIRKHNPDDTNDLGRLVRDALGERIRPTEPGGTPRPVEERDEAERNNEGGNNASSLPSWASDADGFTF